MSPKISLDSLIDSLLQEASQEFQETVGLKWEWDHYNRIYDILSKIREKESGRDGSDVGTDEEEQQRRSKNCPAFIKWLEDNGAELKKVNITNTGITGFGLKTNVPLKAGELVFTVPKSIILTSEKARESKIKLLVEKDPLLSVMENVLLAIFLVYERFVNFDNSFWKHYLSVLPSTFDTILYFTKEEITLLKQSPKAFRESLRMYRHVARQYAYFHTKFRKATDSASRLLRTCFTYSRYVWGVSAVTTRINHLPSLSDNEEDEGRVLSLIPLWDLSNHEENSELSTDYNEEDNVLTCYASHDFDEDTEFKIYYGRRSSVDFLVHNGFVPESYKDDSYCLELGVSINDPNYFRKKAILSHLGLQCQSTFNVKPDRLMCVKNLFTFLRVFQADKDVLDKIEIEENLEDLEFLSTPNEETWKFLATRFSILHKFTENSTNAALKTIYSNGTDLSHDHLSRGAKMLLQLLKNELKVLEMLIYCSNDHLKQCTTAKSQ